MPLDRFDAAPDIGISQLGKELGVIIQRNFSPFTNPNHVCVRTQPLGKEMTVGADGSTTPLYCIFSYRRNSDDPSSAELLAEPKMKSYKKLSRSNVHLSTLYETPIISQGKSWSAIESTKITS